MLLLSRGGCVYIYARSFPYLNSVSVVNPICVLKRNVLSGLAVMSIYVIIELIAFSYTCACGEVIVSPVGPRIERVPYRAWLFLIVGSIGE